jgi:hypothetical protein
VVDGGGDGVGHSCGDRSVPDSSMRRVTVPFRSAPNAPSARVQSLNPLSAGGLCDAVTTTPASASYRGSRSSTASDANSPKNSAVTPSSATRSRRSGTPTSFPLTLSRDTAFSCSIPHDVRPARTEGILASTWVVPDDPPARTLPQVRFLLRDDAHPLPSPTRR